MKVLTDLNHVLQRVAQEKPLTHETVLSVSSDHLSLSFAEGTTLKLNVAGSVRQVEVRAHVDQHTILQHDILVVRFPTLMNEINNCFSRMFEMYTEKREPSTTINFPLLQKEFLRESGPLALNIFANAMDVIPGRTGEERIMFDDREADTRFKREFIARCKKNALDALSSLQTNDGNVLFAVIKEVFNHAVGAIREPEIRAFLKKRINTLLFDLYSMMKTNGFLEQKIDAKAKKGVETELGVLLDNFIM